MSSRSSLPPVAPESNETLLAALLRADPHQTEDFVRANAPMAFAVARRFLGNDADAQDAVQDAFFSFFRSLGTFKGQAKLSTWLHRIVVNAALMKRRAQARNREQSIEELLPRYGDDGHRLNPQPAWPLSTADLVQREDVRELVRTKIDSLPEDYRNVLVLRDIEGLDTSEAAQALGDTPGAVKTRLHRARQALRALLEREVVAWQTI